MWDSFLNCNFVCLFCVYGYALGVCFNIHLQYWLVAFFRWAGRLTGGATSGDAGRGPQGRRPRHAGGVRKASLDAGLGTSAGLAPPAAGDGLATTGDGLLAAGSGVRLVASVPNLRGSGDGEAILPEGGRGGG